MVLDTQVFAYSLLGVAPFREQASAVIEQCDWILIPDLLRAELANVVWQWVIHRDVSQEMAIQVLRDAESLFDQVIPTDSIWEHALELAVDARHPVYDSLFVAAAKLADEPLISFDRRLQQAFPDTVLSPDELLHP